MPRSQNNVNYSPGFSVWYRNNMNRRKKEGKPGPWKLLAFSTVFPVREAYTKGAASTPFPWGARLSGKRQDLGSVPIPAILPDICAVSVPAAGGSRIPGCSCNANPHLYLFSREKNNLFPGKYSNPTCHRAQQTQLNCKNWCHILSRADI